jgi:hypothetical protein
MFMHRRITLACAVAALAVAPGTAVAMPADNGPAPAKTTPPTVIREVPVPVDDNNDTTLALVFSGSALLIAAGAAALSGHDHRQISRLA